MRDNCLTRYRALAVLLAALAQLPAAGRAQLNAEPLSACRSGMRPYEASDGLQLLGELVRGDFPRLLPGWDAAAAAAAFDAADLAVLAAVDHKVEIICVLGTWCSDSRREVPRFWRILEQAANPNLELTLFGVGRRDDARADEILREMGFDESPRTVYGVGPVPTFIFRRDGVELGRIVETPTATLERDAALFCAAGPVRDPEPAWR